MKFFHYYEPVFHLKVWFFSDCTQEEFRRKMERRKIFPRAMENCDGLTFSISRNGRDVRVVWVENSKSCYTVIHELIHVVQNFMQDIGIPHDRSTKEFFAYYYTNLLKVITNKLR